MRGKIKIVFILILLVFSLLTVSCKDEKDEKVLEIEIISDDSLMVNFQDKLEARVLFENGDLKISSVNWTSLDSSLATVNGSVLKGLSAGAVEITAEKGGITASKTVNVIPESNNVSIVKKENYYDVVLDYRNGATAYEIGAEYAVRIKDIYPAFERNVEAYMMYNINLIRANYTMEAAYKILIQRVEDIKENVPEKYQHEIEGIASQFSAFNSDKYGDGKMSLNELYAFNMITDVLRPTQCSAAGVYGDLADYNHTTIGRNLDWDDGGILCSFASIITIKSNEKSIVSIGYLAHMGALSVFNEDGVFGAILDSPTGEWYESYQKRSYAMDLRYALETYDDLDDVADYMKDDSRDYTYSHLIFLADKERAAVLENNISDSVTNVRELRETDSTLHEGVEWGIDNSVGVVNAFMLRDNYDNFEDNAMSTGRWYKMKEQLKLHRDGEPVEGKITPNNMKDLMAFANNDGPGTWQSGDLYNDSNLYTVIFQPDTMYLSVAFKPLDGDIERPWYPLYNDIEVNFD